MAASLPAIAAPKIPALIVDGINNHDWQAGTAAIRETLLAAGRFTVSVSTSPPAQAPPGEWAKWRPNFAAYPVVINNFNGGHKDDGIRWPRQVELDFEQYVRSGGGLVIFHAANNAFLHWRAYNEIIGLGWRDMSFGPSLIVNEKEQVVVIPRGQGLNPGHGPRHDFELVIRDPRHPITQGLPKRWLHPSEQLTHGQHGLPSLKPDDLTILSYAWSKDSHENEPLDWVRAYGNGRVYVTMLGHTWRNEDNPNLRDKWFRQLLARGTEWAAGSLDS